MPVLALLDLLDLAAARGIRHDVAGLTTAEWNSVAAVACRHGVAPLLHQKLVDGAFLALVPPRVRAVLADQRRATAARNLLHHAQFRKISRAFADRGVQVMALKGLHLAELVYGDISLRPMSDLDLLVRKSDVEEAVAALLELGFSVAPCSPDPFATDLDSDIEFGFRHPECLVYVELHWNLSRPEHRYCAPLDEIWRTAVRTKIGNVETFVMSPEFCLLYVCAHLASNHAFSLDLRPICDIASIVNSRTDLDWAQVVQNAKQHNWRSAVATTLLLARQRFGVTIPDSVLSEIDSGNNASQQLDDATAELILNPQLSYELNVGPNVMRLSTLRLADRLSTIWKRVFVSREELASWYRKTPDSRILPLYYLVRLRDLVHKHASSARTLRSSRMEIAETVARRARLAAWVSGG